MVTATEQVVLEKPDDVEEADDSGGDAGDDAGEGEGE